MGLRTARYVLGQLDPEKGIGAWTIFLKKCSLFRFQSDLGSRDINRQLKARRLYGSGAGGAGQRLQAIPWFAIAQVLERAKDRPEVVVVVKGDTISQDLVSFLLSSQALRQASLNAAAVVHTRLLLQDMFRCMTTVLDAPA